LAISGFEPQIERPVNGFLNLNKPGGVTSRRVVDQVVRLVGRTKVGHAGTLDPLASGVLVVAVGSATRLIEWVQRMPKTYVATIRLGARSDTLDVEGRVVEAVDPRVPDEADLRGSIATQVGEILQLPPEYSALRVGGRRAHELARAGRAVNLQPRPVRIDRIELRDYRWPRVDLEIDCGGGTYIRSVARDLGEALGCGGILERLVRSRIGHFSIETAVDPSALTAASLPEQLRPPREAVTDLPSITVRTDDQVRAMAQGKTLTAAGLSLPAVPEGPLVLVAPDGRLLALARGDAALATVHPFKVMV
jgi:tRNA pseudouridine55 synthase